MVPNLNLKAEHTVRPSILCAAKPVGAHRIKKGMFKSLSIAVVKTISNQNDNTVKHRNNGKIRCRQILRYLDASYHFVLLISIILMLRSRHFVHYSDAFHYSGVRYSGVSLYSVTFSSATPSFWPYRDILN